MSLTDSMGVEVSEALLKVERGGDGAERNSELHHGERNFRLDPDDDHQGAPQSNDVGHVAQGARSE